MRLVVPREAQIASTVLAIEAQRHRSFLPPRPSGKESAQIDLQPTPELEPTPEEKSRFEKVVEHSPRAAILEKRAELEQAMRAIAEPYWQGTATSSPRSMSLTTSIRILRNPDVDFEEDEELAYYGEVRNRIQNRFIASKDNPRHFEKVQWIAKYWNKNVLAGRGLSRISGPGLSPEPAVWG